MSQCSRGGTHETGGVAGFHNPPLLMAGKHMAKNGRVSINIEDALKIVDLLEKCAGKVGSDEAKKILLKAGCDIADIVLTENKLAKAA